MSAAEVIEEIKRLPRPEQERVWHFLAEARDGKPDAATVRYASDEQFEQVAARVFSDHDNLFRRLAQ